MVRFQKMNNSKNSGILSHNRKDLLGIKVRLAKSLNNDGSVAKVCESLVRLTGGVPKGTSPGESFFIVPVVPMHAGVLATIEPFVRNAVAFAQRKIPPNLGMQGTHTIRQGCPRPISPVASPEGKCRLDSSVRCSKKGQHS